MRSPLLIACVMVWQPMFVAIAQESEWEVFDFTDAVTQGVMDMQNRAWFGTTTGGLLVYDGFTWKRTTCFLGPVSALATSPDGYVWCAAAHDGIGGGVARFHTTHGTALGQREDMLRNRYVYSMVTDARGSIWYADADPKGIGRHDVKTWDGKEWRAAPPADSLSFGQLASRAQGGIWGAFWSPSGYFIMHNDGLQWYMTTQLPERLGVLHLLDIDDALWIGAAEGLFEIDRGGVVHWHAVPSGASVTAMALREAGGLWVGSEDGLFIFEQGAWQRIDLTTAGLPNEHIRMVLAEPSGALWVTAWGDGNDQGRLARYVPVRASASSNDGREAAVAQNNRLHTYPNPTSQAVQISFTASHSSRYTLQIHDVAGRRLHQYQKRLYSGQVWNAAWRPGSSVSAGIYLLVVSDDQRVVARRSVSVVR